MFTNSLLLLLPFLVLTMGYPYNPLSCNCGLGPGEDVCQNKNCPLVVRPVEIPKPVLPLPKVVCAPVGGIPPLVPLPSPCSCHTPVVKPALVPKPVCLACGGCVTNNQQLTLSQKQQHLFGGACGNRVFTPGPQPVIVDDSVNSPVNPANYVPADPVSLSVAYKQAYEECHRNEDKLSFGFRSIPKYIPLVVKKCSNIPEENLFNLNGQIVELKKLKCSSRKSVEEEAAEQLEALAEEEAEDQLDVNANLKRISMGELGYGPAKIKPAQFINVAIANPAAALDDGLSAVVKNCNDGFLPGSVVVKEIPKNEPVILPTPFPEPCPCNDQFCIPPPPVRPPCGACNSPYTYLSSSSSSSASNSNAMTNTVFLQNVSCN